MNPYEIKFLQDETRLFSESSYHETNYLEHNCDDLFELKRYPKNRTFNQMRRDLYFDTYKWSASELNDLRDNYSLALNDPEIKRLNRELHQSFHSKGVILLRDILENYGVIKILEHDHVPVDIPLTNGRFIHFDGNDVLFLGENRDYFYIAEWGGS